MHLPHSALKASACQIIYSLKANELRLTLIFEWFALLLGDELLCNH